MAKFKKGDRVLRKLCDCFPARKGEIYTVENPEHSPGHLTLTIGGGGLMESRFELVEAAPTSEQEQRKAAADRVWAAEREFHEAVFAAKALDLSVIKLGFEVQSIDYTQVIKEKYERGSVAS